MRYGLNILVQAFCPLKIKITQFPNVFRTHTILYFHAHPFAISARK